MKFSAESGGQVADTGELTSTSGSFTVTDTKAWSLLQSVLAHALSERGSSPLPPSCRSLAPHLLCFKMTKSPTCPAQLTSLTDSMAGYMPNSPQVPPDMQVAAGYVLHVGSMSRGTLDAGSMISAEVDHVRRGRIVPNHTFTHVLNYALREVRRSNDEG